MLRLGTDTCSLAMASILMQTARPGLRGTATLERSHPPSRRRAAGERFRHGGRAALSCKIGEEEVPRQGGANRLLRSRGVRLACVPAEVVYGVARLISQPSRRSVPAISSAATASAHHQPNAESRRRLIRVAAARTAPARLRTPSPCSAELSSGLASRSLALARMGRTSTDAAVRSRADRDALGVGAVRECK